MSRNKPDWLMSYAKMKVQSGPKWCPARQ
jgi:hypothetical protein